MFGQSQPDIVSAPLLIHTARDVGHCDQRRPGGGGRRVVQGGIAIDKTGNEEERIVLAEFRRVAEAELDIAVADLRELNAAAQSVNAAAAFIEVGGKIGKFDLHRLVGRQPVAQPKTVEVGNAGTKLIAFTIVHFYRHPFNAELRGVLHPVGVKIVKYLPADGLIAGAWPDAGAGVGQLEILLIKITARPRIYFSGYRSTAAICGNDKLHIIRLPRKIGVKYFHFSP